MISELCPRSHPDYVALPILGPLLDEFTQWSFQRGYVLATIKRQLDHSRQLIGFWQEAGVDSWQELLRGHFENAWQRFHHDRPAVAGTVRQLERFFDETRGLPPSPGIPATRSGTELQELAGYLNSVRGLGESTVRAHLRYSERFLDFIGFEVDRRALIDLRREQIDSFIGACSETMNRHSLQHLVAYLRAFLRFEYGRGILRKPFHETIDRPRVYRLEKLPRCLPWATVDELLRSIDRTDAQGIRNYAMLLLVATYGLRSCEVAALKIDDIHWRIEQIDIFQGKNNNQLVLPLTDSVANALIDYLKMGRPPLPCRKVFLRVRAPHGTLKPTAVAEAFQRAVRLSDLDIPYNGAHCLRHSYAVHLLRQGVSAKSIGDVLGHRSLESTCVYARLAIDDLRNVALEVPECPEVDVCLDSGAVRNLPRIRPTKRINVSCSLQSFLGDDISRYLQLHRSLGKGYRREERVLRWLDYFLLTKFPSAKRLAGKVFSQWAATLSHLTAADRRARMRIARNFCLYRQRSHPSVFVPDILTFPATHSQFYPFILSRMDIARLLSAARHLPRTPQSSLRPEAIRLAILLLFTTGIRSGELLRLTLDDFKSTDSMLLVRATKFHKDRLIPLSLTADAEYRNFLDSRQQQGLPMDRSSPIMWNNSRGPAGRVYSSTSLHRNWRLLCVALRILTQKGVPPRIHDVRHSFAVNALLRWYEDGEDLLAKLPQLSTYMGHVSIASTQRYLPFVEPLRTAAGALFESKYGALVVPESVNPQYQ